MAFRHWSTTATGNANPGSLGTINWAEGMAPSAVNNSARQTMAEIRTIYGANEWAWVQNSATASVASQTTFKVANDQTTLFTSGRRVRLTGGSTTKYGNVVSASYTTETTVTITKDSGSLSASHSIASLAAPYGPTLPRECIVVACSDETTALTTGTAKVTFRMPKAFTLLEVRASLSTAQTSGNIFTVDINEAGTTVISTKLTIDNGEKTSTTAVTPPVISDSAIADDAEMTVDIDQIGDGTAKGLKVYLIGYQA